MILFRAIHATKVLALAGLVLATSCIPMQAADRSGGWGGPPQAETRTRHIRMNSHRPYPRYDFDRMGSRRDWNRMPRRDWADNGGPPEVETRTRHVRLPRYRPGAYAGQWQHRGGWVRDRGGRDIWLSDARGQDRRPGIHDGLPEVETRTRHVRLPQYRPYTGRLVERWGDGGGWVRDRAGREIWTSSGRSSDYRQGVYGGDEFPDIIPGIGTYVGGISAYVDVGNGIYFSQEGDYRYADDGGLAPPAEVNRGKIIDVTPQTMNRACAYEHGICVIRR
ncbi:hypothetical protein [Ensifer sp.]|jgi:hypothetical protein|uniref:hypothetical protein n=1 Tax=Ensifer sp. TaxID=1872086 RepID=UPI002E0E30A5|nr:hypothetical protein [Ensifer sp.]